MNTEVAAAAPAPAAVRGSVAGPVSRLKKVNTALDDAGRWILIALYVFGLLIPFVGAALAWILL